MLRTVGSVLSGKMYYHPIKGIPIRGVIFDMDGTLTIPCIDFKLMRERVGILEGDILTIAAQFPEPKRTEAFQTIHEIEVESRVRLELQPGITKLLQFLKENGIHTGIVSRNSQSSMEYFIEKLGFDHFSHKITRDQPFQLKPHPECSEYLCNTWKLPRNQVLFVGDFRDDMICGNKAGNVTCLVKNPSNLKYIDYSDLQVDKLDELVDMLQQGFSIDESMKQNRVNMS